MTQHIDTTDTDLMRYLDLLEAEVRLLRSVLPSAIEMQWETPPGRGGGTDPTGSTATDPARMNLRYQLRCSADLMKNALINVRGVRRGLDRRLSPYMGERASA